MHVTSVTETSGLAGNNNIVANELNRRDAAAWRRVVGLWRESSQLSDEL